MVAWMRKKNSLVRWPLLIAACLVMAGCQEHFIGLLNPKGIVAYEERKLFFDTLALMLIVVLPVIIMSLTFIYQYQASRRNPDYKPNWSHSYFLESLWWGIPCVIIVVLAVMTWKQTHELDPYHKIPGNNKPPMVIEAIALPWKWLFIYPEQNIATVNYVEIPVGEQIQFVMTADNVPMSAFFIPQLGSQIYTMAGMRSELHLLSNEIGVYDGMNTQFNGDGFSDMHFAVHVVDEKDMTKWVSEVKNSQQQLSKTTYSELLNPSINDQPKYFSGVDPAMFDQVIHLYMTTFGKTHPREDQLKLRYEIH